MIVAIPDYAWSMPAVHTIHTYAKINLILQVAPPISDPEDPNHGMHPICSWMHSINLCDEITIEHTPNQDSLYDIHWTRGGKPVTWDLISDLIVRAHRLLEEESGRSLPVKVTASKKIPAGGGLGGGSSNAAGVMMGLNDVFELGYDEQSLQTIASKLGSDIPYFIDFRSHQHGISPRPAVVTGCGSEIDRMPRARKTPFILLFPDFGCPTADVYHAFDKLGRSRELEPERVKEIASRGQVDPSLLMNDLLEPAIQAQPLLAESLEYLNELKLSAYLSGSGSTIYLPMNQLFGHPDYQSLYEMLRKHFVVENALLE
jgi:4-diphosphocytidyl-2-C-methyl-D-erythritol kinase